jgi:hypothetical protein
MWPFWGFFIRYLGPTLQVCSYLQFVKKILHSDACGVRVGPYSDLSAALSPLCVQYVDSFKVHVLNGHGTLPLRDPAAQGWVGSKIVV